MGAQARDDSRQLRSRAIRGLASVTLTAMVAVCLVMVSLPAVADELDRAVELFNTAMQLREEGRLEEAIPYAAEAVRIFERLLGPEDQATGGAIGMLGVLYFELGDNARAEPLLKRSLRISEQTKGPDHPDTITSLSNLGQLYVDKGEFARAEEPYRRVLEYREQTLGPEHPDTALDLYNLAKVCAWSGENARAERLYRRCIEVTEKVLGRDHPRTGIATRDLAFLYRKTGDYEQSEPLFLRSLAILEQALGPDHEHTATTVEGLGVLYQRMAEYKRAEPLLERCLAINERTKGPEHPSTGLALKSLGDLYHTTGRFDEAESLLARGFAILEEALGPEHPDTAKLLSSLASVYMSRGKYKRAESLLERCLAINEKSRGPEHPRTSMALSSLGDLYHTTGRLDEAVALYERGLAIIEKSHGPEHTNTAMFLSSLASVYLSMGEYERAEQLYERSLKICEKLLGPEHPETVGTLSNLANLYLQIGDYARAELLFKRCLALYEKVLGPEHPETASSLNNLASLYDAIGDRERAKTLYQRGFNITEKVFGSEHPNTATSMSNLALVYTYMGEYERAEPLLELSLEIRERVLGPQHPDTANTINNLAVMYADMGDFDNAEPLLERSIAIHEKALGPDHPETANALSNLAIASLTFGDLERAEPLLERSIAIFEKVFGPEHETTTTSRFHLAALYASRGELDMAHRLFRRSLTSNAGTVEQVMGFTSEDQKLKFLASKRGIVETFMSFIVQLRIEDPAARREALDVWLARKGIVLEAQQRFQEALIGADNPEAVATSQELARTRTRLSRLFFVGPGDDPDAYQRRLAELEASKQELESRLSRLSQTFARNQEVARADSQQVAAALPAGSVLIELLRCGTHSFEATTSEEIWGTDHYLAFVLAAGRPVRVSLVDLGEETAIDQAVTELKRVASRPGQLGSTGSSRPARELYDLVFAPLEAHLGPATEIYISPDGDLSLIPFEILEDASGRHLIERFTFNYLTTGRDLVGFGRRHHASGSALLIGDPDYDLGQEQRGQAVARLGLATDEAPGPGTRRSPEVRGLSFTRLPGTRAEVDAIHHVLGSDSVKLYTGESALEEVVKAARSPRFLHIATHGFFLSDLDLAAFDDSRLARGLRPLRKAEKKPRTDNPLLRSGLALAGANNADTGQASDGLLTAEEVLGLDLRSTEMVTLSACQTGLGEVKRGEGVYGLRRAFAIAGAASQVMSMWSVPDRETKELMVQLYRNIDAGMSRSQALRQAALAQRAVVEERYGAPDPYYWGAFVFVGEPGRWGERAASLKVAPEERLEATEQVVEAEIPRAQTSPADVPIPPLAPADRTTSDCAPLGVSYERALAVLTQFFSFSHQGTEDGHSRWLGRSANRVATIELLGQPDDLCYASLHFSGGDHEQPMGPHERWINGQMFLFFKNLVPTWPGARPWASQQIANDTGPRSLGRIVATTTRDGKTITIRWQATSREYVVTVEAAGQ